MRALEVLSHTSCSFHTVPCYPMISEQAIKSSSRVYLKPCTSILIVKRSDWYVRDLG